MALCDRADHSRATPTRSRMAGRYLRNTILSTAHLARRDDLLDAHGNPRRPGEQCERDDKENPSFGQVHEPRAELRIDVVDEESREEDAHAIDGHRHATADDNPHRTHDRPAHLHTPE